MILSKADMLHAIRRTNEERKENKQKLREQLEREVRGFLAQGGTIEEVPEGATTTTPLEYGYGVMGTQMRGSRDY